MVKRNATMHYLPYDIGKYIVHSARYNVGRYGQVCMGQFEQGNGQHGRNAEIFLSTNWHTLD
jgi:hypothetical protein